jgi:pimeloyl-ACP methyl ester carboxylesterase
MSLPAPIRNAQGERLDVAFTAARNAARGTAQSMSQAPPLVIIGHGVTSHHDRPYLVALGEACADAGLASLRLSFAGNGESEGRFEECTLSKEVSDLGAVLDACDGWRPAYVGHSMGAAVGALRAAQDRRLAALVSLAGMTHVQTFMETHFGQLTPGRDVMLEREHALLSQAFLDDARQIGDVLDAARRVEAPWLLVHGTDDELVPFRDSEDLRRAAGPQASLHALPGADHVFAGQVDALCEAVVPWLARQLGPPAPG